MTMKHFRGALNYAHFVTPFFPGSQNEYVKNGHLHTRLRYYTCEQKRKKLIRCPALHSLCVVCGCT